MGPNLPEGRLTASAATVEAAEAATVMEAFKAIAVVEGFKMVSISTNRTADVAVADVAVPVVSVIAAVVCPTVETTPAEGVKAPSKRAREWSEAHVGIVKCPRIPVPAGTGVRTGVISCHLIVGFGHVFGAQTAPVVQVVLGIVFVEAGRLFIRQRLPIGQCQFVVFFDLPPLVVTNLDVRFTFEDHGFRLAGVEFVIPALVETRRYAAIDHLKIVLVVDLVDFDSSSALVEFHLRERQVGRNHFRCTRTIEAQKDARRKQNFGFAFACGNFLARLQDCVANIL